MAAAAAVKDGLDTGTADVTEPGGMDSGLPSKVMTDGGAVDGERTVLIKDELDLENETERPLVEELLEGLAEGSMP